MPKNALTARPRILVVGAGVLGTVYAAKLSLAGHDVTIIEKSPVRKGQLEEQGLAIRLLDGSKPETVRVPIIDDLDAAADFDLAIVIARKIHLTGILDMLTPTSIPDVLIMMSNAEGPAEIVEALGERAVLGFPGAGGRVVDGVVEYQISPAFMAPTMLGEIDGTTTERVKVLSAIFEGASFHPKITPAIDSWLKSHEAFVASLGNATIIAGSGAKVAADKELLTLNILAIREVYAAMAAAGLSVEPSWFSLWRRLPLPVIRATYSRFIGSAAWDVLGTDQLHSMRNEIEVVTEELLAFARAQGMDAPSLAELARRRGQLAAA